MRHLADREAALLHEVERQPGEQEIEAVIDRKWPTLIVHNGALRDQPANRKALAARAALRAAAARASAPPGHEPEQGRPAEHPEHRRANRNLAMISPPASARPQGHRRAPRRPRHCAIPRRAGGTWRQMIFELPGKAMLSPSPSSSRKRPARLSDPTRPIAVGAERPERVQRQATGRPEKRSHSQPTASWIGA